MIDPTSNHSGSSHPTAARSGVVDRKHSRSKLSWELQWAELLDQRIVFSAVTGDGKGSKRGVCTLNRDSSISDELPAQGQLTSISTSESPIDLSSLGSTSSVPCQSDAAPTASLGHANRMPANGDRRQSFSSPTVGAASISQASPFLSQISSASRSGSGFVTEAMQLLTATRSGRVSSDRPQMKYPHVFCVKDVYIDGETTPSDLCLSVESLESKQAWMLAICQGILNDNFVNVLRSFTSYQQQQQQHHQQQQSTVSPGPKLLSMIKTTLSSSSSTSSPSAGASTLVASMAQLSDVAIEFALDVKYPQPCDLPTNRIHTIAALGAGYTGKGAGTGTSDATKRHLKQPMSVKSLGSKPPRLVSRSPRKLSVSCCPWVTVLMVNPDFQWRDEKEKETFIHWIAINGTVILESVEVSSTATMATSATAHDKSSISVSISDGNSGSLIDEANYSVEDSRGVILGTSDPTSVGNKDFHSQNTHAGGIYFSIDFPESICEYVPPCPTFNSGVNRVLVFVFQQKGLQQSQPMDSMLSSRLSTTFDVKQWQVSMNLGSLIGIDWFPVTYEECMDSIHQQLGLQPHSFFQLPKPLAATLSTASVSSAADLSSLTSEQDTNAQSSSSSTIPATMNIQLTTEGTATTATATTATATAMIPELIGGEIIELSEVQFNKILASLRRAEETAQTLAATVQQVQLDRDAATQQATLSHAKLGQLEARYSRVDRLHSLVMKSLNDLRESAGSLDINNDRHLSSPPLSTAAVAAAAASDDTAGSHFSSGNEDGSSVEAVQEINCTKDLHDINEDSIANAQDIDSMHELLDWLLHFTQKNSSSRSNPNPNPNPNPSLDTHTAVELLQDTSKKEEGSGDRIKSLERELSEALLNNLVIKVEMNRMESGYEEQLLDLDFQVRTLQQSLADSHQQVGDLLASIAIVESLLEAEKAARLSQRDELEADVLDQLLSLKNMLGNKSEMCYHLERENEEMLAQLAAMSRDKQEASAVSGDRMKRLDSELVELKASKDNWDSCFKQQEEVILNLKLLLENEKKAKQLMKNNSMESNVKFISLSTENMRLKTSLEEALRDKEDLHEKLSLLTDQYSQDVESLQSQLDQERRRKKELKADAERSALEAAAGARLGQGELEVLAMQCRETVVARDLWQRKCLDAEQRASRLETRVQELVQEMQQSGDVSMQRRLEKENARLLAQVLDKSSVLGLKTQLNEAMSERTFLKSQYDQQASEYQLDIQTLSDKLCAKEFELEDERLTKDRLQKAEASWQEEIECLRAEIETLMLKQQENETILFDIDR